MEHPSCAVALVGPHDRVAQRLNVARDNVSDLSIHIARFAVLNGLHQRIIRRFDESPRALADLAN